MRSGAAPARPQTAVVRLYSALPSRRAVLHVRAAGDPAVPPDLVTWFTERAFHYYLAGLQLPDPVRPGPRDRAGGSPGAVALLRKGRATAPGRVRPAAFAELDAARMALAGPDEIAQVVVFAQGQGAAVTARWCADRVRDGRPAADALILLAPRWSAGPGLQLAIDCPVLVLALAGRASQETTAAWRRWRPGGRAERAGQAERAGRAERAGQPAQLGSHVTWLRLGDTAGLPGTAGRPGPVGDVGERRFFDELGRWLGAYMYGRQDRLL